MGPLISSLVSSEMALLIHLQQAVSPARWGSKMHELRVEAQRLQGRNQEKVKAGRRGTWFFRCIRLSLIFLVWKSPSEQLGVSSILVRAFGFVLQCLAGTKVNLWVTLSLAAAALYQAP